MPTKGSHNVVQSRLLDRLSDVELKSVLAKASELRFHRNSVAVNQGHPADRLFILTQGRARFFVVTQDGRKIILRWILPGDVFGAAAISCKLSPYIVGVETVQNSTVLSWSRASIRDLAAGFPQLLENVISISEDYLHWYVSAYEILTRQSAEQRLARLLIGLTEQIGERVSGGIRLDVRNEELANAANMTVFTVSRILKTWQHCRALSKARNSLVLHSKRLLLATLRHDNFPQTD